MNWKKECKWVSTGESFLPLLSMALIFNSSAKFPLPDQKLYMKFNKFISQLCKSVWGRVNLVTGKPCRRNTVHIGNTSTLEFSSGMEADGLGQEMLEEVEMDHGPLRRCGLGISHTSQVPQKYSAIPHTMAKG